MLFLLRRIAIPALVCGLMLITATVAYAWPTNADDATMRSYGYRGDAISRPLSSITTYNGVSTATWQLADWQAVLPAAQSMSDEIDGVVINSLIQMAPASISFHFAPGVALFSTPINTCNRSVSLFGSGNSTTWLDFPNSGAWDHCKGGTDPTAAIVLEAHDIGFHTSTAVAGTYGLNAGYTSSQYKTIRMSNVNFSNFNSCILIAQSTASILEGVTCTSGRSQGDASVGTGIEFQGHNSFATKIINTFVNSYATGYKFRSLSFSGQIGMEDVSLTNAEAGKVQKCIDITSDVKNYTPFQYNITGFYCDSSSVFVNVDAGNFVQIRDGNWLFNGPWGSWSGNGQDMFRFCRVNRVTMSGNLIATNTQGPPGGTTLATVNSLIHILGPGSSCGVSDSGSQAVQIINNYIDYYNLAYNKLIINDPYTFGVTIKDNVFENFFTVQASPPAGSIVWGSASIVIDQASTLTLGRPGDVVTVSPVSGSAGVATSGKEMVAGTASLAPGVWNCTGAFSYVPSGGAVVVHARGIATKTGTIGAYRGPNEVMYQDWNAGISYYTTLPTRSALFDFSNAVGNSTVYFIAYSDFATGSLTMSANGQCVRVR